jgi:uracil-DNA glycosylase
MNYSENISLFNLIQNEWENVIDKEKIKNTQEKLIQQIDLCKKQNMKIYPEENRIFYIFNNCKIDNIKVVILGQDPYHSNENQANGMAFSVGNDTSTPPSLRNIHKELLSCYPDTKIENDLTKWVDQGVFLLNTSLTVVQNKPASHILLWNEFTKHIVSLISQKSNIVFCLWGKNAEKIKDYIDTNTNFIIKCSHPSPLSAYKTHEPFLGSNVFKKINEKLVELNKDPINW